MIIIMQNNVFEFGDMCFLQLLGTAMGTSAAVMWATLYFGNHEVKKLLPTYTPYLHGDKPLSRFIDDKYGFWVCNECKDWQCCHHWQSFKQDLNNLAEKNFIGTRLTKKYCYAIFWEVCSNFRRDTKKNLCKDCIEKCH